ncbi:helix-turn-helix domain-containing protein [Natronomonas salina]|uniref:helix-turn-helix transcriptional regulator n=1 Tax=Natronomonas salina TaxID=1710540 RepID=UPI0015B3D1AC|nr:helix-turn-helix domain-containing protein [Natronomonas salina]QLD89433.1 helix-turn-helix domain-containing protein [Natronomonas salina]
MRRTVLTFLLVSAVAVSAALALVGAVGLATTGAAQSMPESGPDEANRSADDARIAYFSVAGRGYVSDQKALDEDHPGPTYVWASESLVLRPTVHTQPNGRTKRACGYLLDEDGGPIESVGCHAWNSTTRQRWARIEFAGWPAEARGTQYVRIELQEEVHRTAGEDGSGTETVLRDTHEAQVTVITKQGDLDGDGLANAREVAVGTDFTRQDTDGDGVSDRAEVYRYDSDPTAADSTGDGVDDGTVASLRLPPTVPYVVHAAVAAGLLGAVGLAAAGVALRRRLRTEPDGPPPAGSRTVATDGSADPDRFVDTKEGEILQILREHDGQMRQTDLVDETEWSKATVSRLLSTLEDEGRVEKIRVGRGNVVRLVGPDAPPTGERSQASG